MIVSDTFVWAHIPKTGGSATAAMIEQVPRLVLMMDPPKDHAKHLSFQHRMGSIRGRLLVANMRRLPAWAISNMRYRRDTGVWPEFVPEGPRPPEVVAAESEADRTLDEIVGDYEVDVWLRQEHLADDLVGFLRRHAGLTDTEEAAVRSVGRLNEHSPEGRFRKRRAERAFEPSRFFTPAHIDELYARNPRWAAVERSVYGDPA